MIKRLDRADSLALRSHGEKSKRRKNGGILAMCDENQVKQCVNMIKTWKIEGGTKMEERDL
jgi:hypothetical protein